MFYGRKGPEFWKNVEAALAEIFPALADQITGLSGRVLDEANEQILRREISGHPGAAKVFKKSFDTNELFGALQKFCSFDKIRARLNVKRKKPQREAGAPREAAAGKGQTKPAAPGTSLSMSAAAQLPALSE